MNDLILADRELEVGFIGKLDALFEGIERMDASHKASPSNERFLTDREVSARLKVSRRTLQDYRNNGIIAYYQLGGKILYKESDIESIIVNKRNTTGRHQVVFLTLSSRISFVSTTWGFSCTCRQRKEQI